MSQQKFSSKAKKSDFFNGSCSCPSQTCTPYSSAPSHLPLKRNRANALNHQNSGSALHMLQICHPLRNTQCQSTFHVRPSHLPVLMLASHLQPVSNGLCMGSDLIMFSITSCNHPKTAINVFCIDPDETIMLFKCK